MTKTFIILFDPGPNWNENKEIENQDFWDEHVEFVDKLFIEGKVVIAGPIIHYDRIVIIYDAVDESEVRITFKDDPFISNGILHLESVMEWNIRLDQRNNK
ncbi:YciI family protein [Bacteroidota bacterium]